MLPIMSRHTQTNAARMVASQTVRIAFVWPSLVSIPMMVAIMRAASITSRKVIRKLGNILYDHTMIPTDEQAKILWDKYQLPKPKRIHVSLVARVAVFLAAKIQNVDTPLLRAAALLHDIDKAVLKLPGETHPDTGVRILKEEGMREVAALVKTHSLHAILDPRITPITWEQKLLFLSDKMVKYEIITVDKRFALWRAENLPPDAIEMLDKTYPKVKQLEKEIFTLIGIMPEEVVYLFKEENI